MCAYQTYDNQLVNTGMVETNIHMLAANGPKVNDWERMTAKSYMEKQ